MRFRFVAAFSLLTLCSCASQTPATGTNPTPTAAANAPETLPYAVRRQVAAEMTAHGLNMSDLLWSVLYLDQAFIAELAKDIADKPRFAHPRNHQNKDQNNTNADVPLPFQELEQQLRNLAQKLVATAKTEPFDPVATSELYGKMAETCVRCHALYFDADAK